MTAVRERPPAGDARAWERVVAARSRALQGLPAESATGAALQASLAGAVAAVCGFCAALGRPVGAAREYGTGRWRDVPHEYVQLVHRLGLATDGACSVCGPLLRKRDAKAAEKRHGACR